MDKIYRILVINPGSTSTKLSMFENETCLFTEDVFHDSSVLKKFPTINDQLDYRMEVVDKFLKDGNIDLTGVDAIVGRGGGCYSVEGGIYKIDDRLIQDTKAAKGGLYHSSMLGVQMADVLHKKYGGIMIMMNPPIVDELCDLARVTGVDGVYRRAVCHLHAQHGRMIKSTLCSLGILDQTIINLVDTTFHGIASTASSNDGIHSGQVNISIFQEFINYFHAIVQLVIDGRKLLQYR